MAIQYTSEEKKYVLLKGNILKRLKEYLMLRWQLLQGWQ